MEKGLFISYEGGEGAGKSTVIQETKSYLDWLGVPCIITREPGGIQIAEKIREVILDVSHTSMDERTEALLYAAARRQHLVEKVIPALNKGVTVLCDRFVDSSLAYQGHARGLGIDNVLEINKFAIRDCMPELTLWLDIDPKVGMERIHRNSDREVNRLDLEAMEFHEKVREGYCILQSRYPERIKRINADQTVDYVAADVRSVLVNYIENQTR